jgi:hypothetical protein
VAGWPGPVTVMLEAEIKFVPFTVNVCVVPAETHAGDKPLIDGVGLVIEFPPVPPPPLLPLLLVVDPPPQPIDVIAIPSSTMPVKRKRCKFIC